MELKRSSREGVSILEVRGRFDAYVASTVEQWFKEVVAIVPAQVVVDLREARFIDSTGLATLVQGMKQCRQQQGDVLLCSLSQPVRIIIELTRFDRVFKIFETQAEAVAYYHGELAVGQNLEADTVQQTAGTEGFAHL